VYTSVEPSAASAGDTRTRITRKKQRSFFIYLSPPKTLYQKRRGKNKRQEAMRMKVPNGVTYDKIADGCDGMAGKLTDTERGMPLWMLMNPEIEELKRRTDALEKRAAALEKEIVLLVWAIAAAAAAVAAVLLVCM
jgi:hypothetical protein